MDCREFESVWNERLDARGAAGPSAALDAHAAACPKCRALGARYQTLAQALQTLGPLPAPRAGFADRVLNAAAAPPVDDLIPFRVWWTRVAAAAVVLASVGLGVRVWTAGRVAPGVAPGPVGAPTADSEDLSRVLTVATMATLDLAREASAPAARVGRQVLVSATLPGPPPALGLPESVSPVSNVWGSVGDRFNAGVGPLGGSARHAFGFLFRSTPEAPAPPPEAPKRGA